MKRGQSEIIGLVVVVLILVFALIFFVKVRNSDDDNESRLIRSNLRANSALNALMKANVDRKNQMKDYVQKCVDDTDPNDPNECALTRSILNESIKENMKIDDKEFQLIVSVNGVQNPLVSLGTDCRSSISASPFVLRGNGKVEFKVCT